MTGDPARDDHATGHPFGVPDSDDVLPNEYADHQRRTEKGTVLSVDEDGTVRVSGMTPIERALIEVGSERSAIDHCQRLYKLDRKTARLLVRAVRNGEEVDGDE